jgi:hypothetical protein
LRALSANFQYTGHLSGVKWRYSFHGLAECDLRQIEDGRFIEIEFGPRGRYDTFSGWGTMLFVMASKPPWRNYSRLKHYLADKPPPYNYLSGSHHKMLTLAKPIEMLGLFEVADKELSDLKSKLKKRYTYIDNEGRHIFAPPAPYSDFTSHLWWDLNVCDSWVLSERGKELFANNLEPDHFFELWSEI